MSKSKASKNTRQISHVRDSADALQNAINNLMEFANKGDPSTLNRVGNFIRATFSRKARIERENDKSETLKEVLKAIKTIKSHYPLIPKLKGGNQKEKRLADAILSAITQYHKVLDEKTNASSQWRNTRIAQFFCGASVLESLKSHRIELPHEAMIQWSLAPENDKVRHTFQSRIYTTHPQDPLLAQESDALRMKASTLMRQNGVCFKTASEGLLSIRNAPIQASFDSESQVSTLCLTLELIPGTTVGIMGSFKRNMVAKISSTPIPNSFKFTFHSTQTGFPYPLQYAGWAFPGTLLPAYPHYMEKLPLFKSMYEARKEASSALTPTGHSFEQAKQLLSFKRQILEENRQDVLYLNCKLCHAMITAVGMDGQAHKDVVDRFFNSLEHCQNPFNHLAETWRLINDSFANQPHARLQEIWLERSAPALFDADPNVIQQTARNIIEAEQAKALRALVKDMQQVESSLTKHTLEFICCMEAVLAASFREILLQGSSETLRCPPRMLEEFAQKLQLIACNQLADFLEELNWKLDSMPAIHIKTLIKQRLRQELLADISIFETEDFDAIDNPHVPLVEELEVYFNSVYFDERKARA